MKNEKIKYIQYTCAMLDKILDGKGKWKIFSFKINNDGLNVGFVLPKLIFVILTHFLSLVSLDTPWKQWYEMV